MTRSSNSGENHSVYQFEESIELIKITSKMLPRIMDDLKIEIIPENYIFNDVVNYNTLEQINLPMDVKETLNVFSYIDTSNVNIYDIILELEFEGTDETTQIHNIDSRPEMNMKTIKRVLESRGL
jgi:dephospho-CoA kinase